MGVGGMGWGAPSSAPGRRPGALKAWSGGAAPPPAVLRAAPPRDSCLPRGPTRRSAPLRDSLRHELPGCDVPSVRSSALLQLLRPLPPPGRNSGSALHLRLTFCAFIVFSFFFIFSKCPGSSRACWVVVFWFLLFYAPPSPPPRHFTIVKGAGGGAHFKRFPPGL